MKNTPLVLLLVLFPLWQLSAQSSLQFYNPILLGDQSDELTGSWGFDWIIHSGPHELFKDSTSNSGIYLLASPVAIWEHKRFQEAASFSVEETGVILNIDDDPNKSKYSSRMNHWYLGGRLALYLGNPERRKLTAQIGVTPAFVIGGSFKQKYRQDDSRVKDVIRFRKGNVHPHTTRFVVSPFAAVSFGMFSLYAEYRPMPFFKEGAGPDLQMLKIGIGFLPEAGFFTKKRIEAKDLLEEEAKKNQTTQLNY